MMEKFIAVELPTLDTDPGFNGQRLLPSVDPVSKKMYKVPAAEAMASVGTGFRGPADATTNPNDPTPPTTAVYYSYNTPGTYTHFLDSGGNPIVVPANEAGDLVFNGEYWTRQPYPIDLSAYQTKAAIETAPSGVTGKNKFRPDLVVSGQFVNSVGDLANNVNAKACIGMPVTPGQWTVSGFQASGTISCQPFDDSNTKVGGVLNINAGYPGGTTITIPTGTTKVNFTVKVTTAGAADNTDSLQWELGAGPATAYEPPYPTVTKDISGNPFAAKFILPGNSTPDPVTGPNAVNKNYFDLHAVRDVDLGLVPGKNLFNTDWIISDMFISSTGAKASGAGWQMIEIPVTPGDKHTFKDILLTGGGYSAYYASNKTSMLQYNGSFTNISQPKTYTAPAGAAYLYIDIKRPADATSVYAFAQVVIGTVPLDPYEPYGNLIETIRGYRINGTGDGGGQLPTDPVFNSVTATDGDFSAIIVAAMNVLNMQTGAGAQPPTAEPGDLWCDTSNGRVIKVAE